MPLEDKQSIKPILLECYQCSKPVTCPETGAASRTLKTKTNPVARIARNSSVNFRYGRLLFHTARYFRPEQILELGTSIGISTVYLSKGNPGARVFTLEGCPEKSEYALELFQKYGLTNIDLVNGAFDETLSDVLKKMQKVDLVFMDGDHQYERTLEYYEQIVPYTHNDTVVVMDDIHWSAGMEKAWKEIQNKNEVKVTIDLFQFGFVFFKKELSKQNFIIKF